MFLVRVDGELSRSPEIGGEVSVSLGESQEASLDEVSHSSGVSTRG